MDSPLLKKSVSVKTTIKRDPENILLINSNQFQSFNEAIVGNNGNNTSSSNLEQKFKI